MERIREGEAMYKFIYLAKRNPSVAAEDWPRHWRSHPKFVSQFPVVSAEITTLNYCARVLQPSLDGRPFDPPGATRDYDGVAVVGGPSKELHDQQMPPDVLAKVLDDEIRVFGDHTKNFSFKAEESLVLGGAPGQGAVIRFLIRKPGTSREDFLAAWKGRPAETARRSVAAGAVVRHVHNEIVAKPPPGYEFDGIAETWFATADEATRAFVDPALAPLADELASICDMERSVTILTYVVYRWPRE
jgi:hypothetical protein